MNHSFFEKGKEVCDQLSSTADSLGPKEIAAANAGWVQVERKIRIQKCQN